MELRDINSDKYTHPFQSISYHLCIQVDKYNHIYTAFELNVSKSHSVFISKVR